jgi:hypothetical protein
LITFLLHEVLFQQIYVTLFAIHILFVKSLALKYRFKIGYIFGYNLKTSFSLTKYFFMRCRCVYKISPYHISRTSIQKVIYMKFFSDRSSDFRIPEVHCLQILQNCYDALSNISFGSQKCSTNNASVSKVRASCCYF